MSRVNYLLNSLTKNKQFNSIEEKNGIYHINRMHDILLFHHPDSISRNTSHAAIRNVLQRHGMTLEGNACPQNNTNKIHFQNVKKGYWKVVSEQEIVNLSINENQDLQILLEKYSTKLEKNKIKNKRKITREILPRDQLIVKIALVRANYSCEIPNCPHKTFSKPDGEQYWEVHHISPLAEGGSDTIDNVACLCPLHHLEIHKGIEAKNLTQILKEIRSKDAEN